MVSAAAILEVVHKYKIDQSIPQRGAEWKNKNRQTDARSSGFIATAVVESEKHSNESVS